MNGTKEFVFRYFPFMGPISLYGDGLRFSTFKIFFPGAIVNRDRQWNSQKLKNKKTECATKRLFIKNSYNFLRTATYK